MSVRVQTRWVAGVLVIAVAAAGWFGWRQAQWRQRFYVETVNQLIYHLDMAERNLVRARETTSYQEETEAMATAFGYLISAHVESAALMRQMAPPRKGQPLYMPDHAVTMLIQYARNLSPDMPDAAVQKRIELLDGLEQALANGLSGVQGEPGYTFALDPLTMRVDVPVLKESLQDYFQAMNPPEHWPRVPTFEDDPNMPALSARRQGSDVVVRADWTRTYKLFPYDWEGYWILARPAAGSAVAVTSDAGPQQRMGTGAFEPAETDTLTADQHEAFRDRLPSGWTAGSYVIVRIPDGLAQTLTLRGAQGELFWLRPRSSEKAVLLPVAP
jgi:hypothetical protein